MSKTFMIVSVILLAIVTCHCLSVFLNIKTCMKADLVKKESLNVNYNKDSKDSTLSLIKERSTSTWKLNRFFLLLTKANVSFVG